MKRRDFLGGAAAALAGLIGLKRGAQAESPKPELSKAMSPGQVLLPSRDQIVDPESRFSATVGMLLSDQVMRAFMPS